MSLQPLQTAIAFALSLNMASWASSLETAIRASDLEAVKASLASGDDPDIQTESGTPVLVLAASMGQVDVVRSLLQAGATVDAVAGGGGSALMYSAGSDNPVLADVLIEAGADVNLRDTIGDPAVNWGAYYGSLKFIRTLLEAGVDTSLRGHGNAFEIALRRGHEETLLVLAKYDGRVVEAPPAGFDVIGRPLLHLAARENDTVSLLSHLASGAGPDSEDVIGYTALMHAARDGQIKAVRLLLDRGADVTHIGHPHGLALTALHLAATTNQNDIVLLLIDRGAGLDVQGVTGLTPFAWAVYENSRDAALSLLEAGADWKIVPSAGTDLRSIVESRGWESVLKLMPVDPENN